MTVIPVVSNGGQPEAYAIPRSGLAASFRCDR